MSSNRHGLGVTRPVSVLNRSIKFSFRDLFKSATKAVVKGATLRYADALGDLTDALTSIELSRDCGEVAWLLIQRSLLQALHDLLEENEPLLYRDRNNPFASLTRLGLPPDDPDAITARLDLSLEQSEMVIDESFFLRPRTLPVLEHFKTPFREWLELFGLNNAEATSIVNRLPSYFVHALNEQWRERATDYVCLKEAFDTPFTKAGAAEQAWHSYAALLRKQVDEPMFVEAFSLRQVYVPLRAYFVERDAADKEARFDPRTAEARNAERVVVKLDEEIDAWLAANDTKDAVRIISGGPGSGKSSFTKMLAAKLAERNGRRVLFVPLHLLALSDDLEESVKGFIRYAAPNLANPLAPEEHAEPSLVIFDGLDELAMQGKLAAELAQQFVRDVRDKVERLNLRPTRLKVLISGRELAVQSNTADFKRPKQILHVLPYFVAEASRKEYTDAQTLLAEDQRQQWWSNYGKVSGHTYEGLPQELNRDELSEITSQPLLNYLVALSHTRGEVNLATETNLNVIYRDLLKAVYERGWGEGSHPALQGVSEEKFVRWLEEIAVAAWHGDGRTTTVEEIKGHTESSGAASLMNMFEEGTDKGITRLLMAFYFRRAGARESGDKTFEFTHKSFGEYLTAKRIVRLLQDMHEELERHRDNVDKGWDERAALVRWIRLCGPSPLDNYLFKFIANEARIAGGETASNWQRTLCDLIGFELRNGLPMESVALTNFKKMSRQARNAEEALLVVLHACALVTGRLSNIAWPHSEDVSFGELLARLVGQRTETYPLILRHLGLLNLEKQRLALRDFFSATLDGTNLRATDLGLANLSSAKLNGADLSYAVLFKADLRSAILDEANLSGASFNQCQLQSASLINADLHGAYLRNADLEGANLSGANLRSVVFDDKTKFRGAYLEGAIFESDEQKQAIFKLAGIGEDSSQRENVEEAGSDVT
ncbi:MAG: pentapeptide repeat-containing protein [Pyrinomonadaceae bacterium]